MAVIGMICRSTNLKDIVFRKLRITVNSLEKLQELLRDLFQLDMTDLDFGLYRLLHLKRHEMEAFLTE